MAKITPYIFSNDAKQQVEFYTNALGGEIQSIMTMGDLPDSPEAIKNKVIHLCFSVGGANIFMSDNMGGDPLSSGSMVELNLDFPTEEEGRKAFGNLSEGGKILDPLKLEFWGDLFGRVEDQYGVRWMITCKPNTP